MAVALSSLEPAQQAQLSPQALAAQLPAMARQQVLVVGDMAIDEMVYGRVDRLSREAPVVLLRHDHTDVILGAAANAAHNMASLGAQVSVLGVLGDDYAAGRLRQAMARDGVEADHLLVDSSRPTTTKTRISGMVNQSVTQQIVRIDSEGTAPLSADIEARLIDTLTRQIDQVDAVLLSDYGLGVVTPAVSDACLALCRQHGKLLAVDSQQPLARFAGAAIMTPNLPEAERNLGYEVHLSDEASLLQYGPTLHRQSGAGVLLVTRSQDGMALFEAEQVTLLPAFNRSDVFDVTGAGDTVVATLLVARAAGASWLQAAVLGNLAASLVVRQFGAATTTADALSDALINLPVGWQQQLRQGPLSQSSSQSPTSPLEQPSHA